MMVTTKCKVCLIGATGVGKTSLTQKFVHSIFSESYRTTIGVQIEGREVKRGDRRVQLVIWDLSGEDEFQTVQPAYISGAAGYLMVVDCTQSSSVDAARLLLARARRSAPHAPFVLVVNKIDLEALSEIQPTDLDPLRERAYAIVETSARSGVGVTEAFEKLVDAILERGSVLWI